MTELIGHADALALIRRGIAANRLAHAYLVTGPPGVGKRTLALEMAKALNCLDEQVERRPCDNCRQCRLTQRGVHPDVRVVKRAPDRKEILLRAPRETGGTTREYHDNVEFIQADAQLRPADGRKKVYLILNASDLRSDAANRLLKTIEEPTAYVHFVLTAGDRGAVLPTILSRCQEIRLRPVPRAELAETLVERGLAEPARAAQLAALAGGARGWALAAARDAGVVELHYADVRMMRDLLGASRLERLTVARGLHERWSRQPESVRGTLRAWRKWWRDVLLVQSGIPARGAHAEQREAAAVAEVAGRVPPSEARRVLGHLQQALSDLDANVNARLALDLLLLRLPS